MKNLYTITFIFIVLLAFTSFSNHPIHISYNRIEIKNNTAFLFTKVFKDDVDVLLSINSQNKNIANSKITSLYKKNITLKTSNSSLALTIDSITLTHKCYLIYSKAKIINNYATIHYTNNLLCSLYDDQKQICIVKNKENEEGFSLNCSENEISIKL